MFSKSWWVCILLAAAAAAAEPPAVDSPFLRRTHEFAKGVKLPYRLLLPQPIDPSREYPCIVFLHGASARGADNEEPLNWGPHLLRTNAAARLHPFVLIVPQCPRNQGWTTPIVGRGTDPLSLTVELMTKHLPKEVRMDARRRYITGVSMGGIGMWSYLCEHPGVFAAGVPVCAAGTPSQVTREAARYPVWVFHSDDDHLIPVQSARSMVAAWKARGGTADYTEYRGLKHSSWKKAYLEEALLPWLFSR